MGARNVAAVFTHWPHLGHVPFRVLVFMALVAKDGDKEPRYWGGVEALAEALGRPVRASGDVAHRDQVAVSSALTALVRAGAVRVLVKPVKGRRAEYGLVIDPTIGQAEPDESAVDSIPAAVDNSRIGQDEPEESTTVRGRIVRLILTANQAEPDCSQDEPDYSQAEPGPKEVKEDRITKRRQNTLVGESPGRVVPLGTTPHGCIRGWLPDETTGQRGSTRCPTCHPPALPAVAPHP